MKYSLLAILFIFLVVLVFTNQQTIHESKLKSDCGIRIGAQVWIEGGTFTMGSDSFYREEGHAHQVTLDSFWIDTHEVTNAQFAKFVDETGYITVAERKPQQTTTSSKFLKPGSAVFTPPNEGGEITSLWAYILGANWKHPSGPNSTILGKDFHPVVHIAFEDAQAYAHWAGRELPTEAQFEFVARSKKENENYAWGGDELAPQGIHMANTWQGLFPFNNSNEDGYLGTAPVGCYEPNNYGAYDLIGNVWEWTSNWYAPRHNPIDKTNPSGPIEEDSYDKNNFGVPVRVIKGGSFLCSTNYCARYRPAARHAQDTGLGSNHIGFRTILNKH